MPATDTDSNRRKRHPKRRSLFPVVVFLIIMLMVSSGVLIFLIRNHIEASSGTESITKISENQWLIMVLNLNLTRGIGAMMKLLRTLTISIITMYRR